MDPSNTLTELSQVIGRGISRNEQIASRLERNPELSPPQGYFMEESQMWEKAFEILAKLVRESGERNESQARKGGEGV